MTTSTAAKRGNSDSSHRGGAVKRHNQARTDRDGDLVMDGAITARNRIRKARGRGTTAPDTGAKAAGRNILNSAAVQREILRHVASGDAVPRGPRTGISANKHMEELKITGWKNSEASSDQDGGLSALIAWLERRGTLNMDKRASARGAAKTPLRIKEYHVDGDALIISVASDEAATLARMDGYQFAKVNIKIEKTGSKSAPRSGSPQDNHPTPEPATEMKQLFHEFLNRRYNAELKLLDLSALGQDPQLNAIGMFDSTSTQSKFFPALMKVCDTLFKSAQEKKETVQSVTLARNQLPSVTVVTSLAQTFPDIKNLDLSENQLADLKSLEPWKNKFRSLDLLIVTGNPLEQQVPDFNIHFMQWYPTLRILNGVQVRTDEEIASASNSVKKSPPPIRAPVFQDEAQIAENFIKQFFLGFDSDRNALANMYYDADSKFSFSVNTRAPRDPAHKEELKPQEWDAYIKRSRNLKHVTQLPARMSRCYIGPEAIRGAWETLPVTRHPNLAADPQRWLIECLSQPGIPDPTGQSPVGVNGFLITIHGEYEEMDVSTGQVKKHRSFDRTFVLGPGGATGVKVISDMWTVRAYGGFAAWQSEGVPVPQQQAAGAVVAAGGGQEELVAELSRITGMNLVFSRQCLEESGWMPEKAMAAFESARTSGLLPQEAFV